MLDRGNLFTYVLSNSEAFLHHQNKLNWDPCGERRNITSQINHNSENHKSFKLLFQLIFFFVFVTLDRVSIQPTLEPWKCYNTFKYCTHRRCDECTPTVHALQMPDECLWTFFYTFEVNEKKNREKVAMRSTSFAWQLKRWSSGNGYVSTNRKVS